MRIAHLINNLDWAGGVETYVLNLIPALSESGNVQAVVFGRRNHEIDVEAELISYSQANPTATADAVVAFQPDVVHVHNIYDRKLLDALIGRIPLVFTTHGYQLICPATDFYLERPREICQISCSWRCFTTTAQHKCMSLRPNHAAKTYAFAKWALRNKDRIAQLIAPSAYAAERHTRAGFPEDKVTVLPYFCTMPPLAEPRPLPKHPTITFMGRIRLYKGFDYFLKTLAALPSHVQGKIVGDLTDQTRAAIRDIATSLGVADRLQCFAWAGRDQIRSLFNETSVFVFPSIWPETLGIVGLEALSTGVPVVAFDTGGVGEWLVPDKTGLLAPIKDVLSSAQAVNSLISDPAAMRRMGANGIELVGTKFSVEHHLSRLLPVYHHAARPTRSTADHLDRAVASTS